MGFGSLKYTFQPCHHVFSAAMVFLHAIRECPLTLSEHYTLDEMESFMDSFREYFTLSAERWPALITCKEEYERLLEPLKEQYVNAVQVNPNLVQESVLDELGEYLWQPDTWLPAGEVVQYPVDVEELDAAVSQVSPATDIEPTDWDRYFDLGF